MEPRVLIVDDHPLVRQGIAQVLEKRLGCAVSEVSDGAAALDAVWKQDLDLVLLDLSLPGRGGIEVLKEIKDARPRLPVLVFSWHSEEEFGMRALKAGAAGYLNKTTHSDVLIEAIEKILKGGKYVSSSLADCLVSQLSADAGQSPHGSLSDREYDVMIRLANGASVSAIAEELHLSVKTISTYRLRILTKLGLKNNAEITRYAVRNALINCD